MQRMGSDSNGRAYPVCESVATWGIWCKEIPFKLFEKVKEPAKRSWYDENGDDEYISSEGLMLEAYTMKVEFGCKIKSDVSDVRINIGAFLDYLRKSGMMRMYSTYTRVGRKNVRLSNVGDKVWHNDQDGDEFFIFEVEFKVNDPVTDVELVYGELNEVANG